ncbi:glycosyltransferase [Brucella pseudogrignonensis]|uniref:glycosyltransferase n=1 Tax=Brucella pseudogrignonensis TaxID=419475 RepID=UPI0028B8F427|nr:glycosyltransferase [Brucella pseudogrignonensis]MDT6941787.1 glycosyltransferase [Brucella pseudogrignonensis]
MKKKNLSQMYNEHSGKVSDKWTIYLKKYDHIFTNSRRENVRLLEIGIQNGGSLEIWSRYFAKGEIFVGCDINECCRNLNYIDDRIHVVVGDANSEKTYQSVTALSKSFDIIIDDGSHKSSDIIKSFSLYFKNIVNGGIYIVEDLHCSYWKDFEGGLFHPHSSISFFKNLVDIINHEHWGVAKSRKSLFDGFINKYELNLDEEALASIHSIEFVNSMCVIYKKSAENNTLGKRIILGKTATVAPNILERHGEIQLKTDQSDNEWTARASPIHEELAEKLAEVRSVHVEVRKVRSELESAKMRAVEAEDCIKDLQRKITTTEDVRDEIQKKLSKSEHTKFILKNKLNESKNKFNRNLEHLEAIQMSTSWRMTSPYRRIGHFLKQIKQLCNDFREAVHKRGGLAASSQLAFSAFKRKGWRGTRERLFQIASETKGYPEWLLRYSTITPDLRARIRTMIGEMDQPPMISIIMPVYNPDLDWLKEAVESVKQQLYPHWQLCIADDCSSDPKVRSALQNMQNNDSRINVVLRETSGHIAEASNSAVSLADGTFLALMGQDDLLSEDALFHIARVIDMYPDAALIYSDEDKFDASGAHFDPHFKSDWNPDLFLSCNMVSHLGVYRKDIFNLLGGFRSDYNGSQDYDLALRFIELLRSEQILHIPHVLYHWRASGQSTAWSYDNKDNIIKAGRRALEDHLKRQNITADVQHTAHGFRVSYALPNPAPMISLIIPTRNSFQLLHQCISSILERTTYQNYEIIIIDNNTDDPDTLSYLKKLAKEKQIKIVRDERPFNYSALNNAAVKLAEGEFIGLVNNDIEVITPGWLEEMLSLAALPGVGAVGARLWYPNDTLQHGGVIVGLGGVACHAHRCLPQGQPGYFARAELIQTMTAVTAACLVIRKSSFEAVGGLNENDLAVAFNDVDLCLKLREAGYRNIWTPYAELYHHESASRGLEDNMEKIQRFQSEIDYMRKRWNTDTFADPAYNPNLTLNAEDFSLAWPPRVKL